MNKVQQIEKLKKQLDLSRVRNKFYRDKKDAAEAGLSSIILNTDAILYEIVEKYGEIEIPYPTFGNRVEIKMKENTYVIKKASDTDTLNQTKDV